MGLTPPVGTKGKTASSGFGDGRAGRYLRPVKRTAADSDEVAKTGGGHRECGSQVVSHTLVQLLVVFIVLGLMQLAFALHVRNLAIDAASEGARRATMAGEDLAAGQRRTEQLLAASLGNLRRHQVTVNRVDEAGEQVIRVTVDSTLPILGPFGLPHTLQVVASSWKDATDETP